jgi:sirohydrochlorin ferrochelatase
MKQKIAFCLSFTFLTTILSMLASSASAEPGLLLIAHGAPNPQWNKPVLEFGQNVAKKVLKDGKYKAVRTALMEFAQPDIPTAVAELEAAGCDRIIAIPLFIAPTGHTHFDVPAVLGIYSSPKTTATLKAEGAKIARPKVPITLVQTLAESDVLEHYAIDEVRKHSKSPRDEAIVFLVHGDPDHELLVERMMRRVATYCCGEAGISYGDWASIGVGQEYLTNGIGAIQTALEHKKRVIVVGLYLSTTAAKIDQHGKMAAKAAKKSGDHAAATATLPDNRVSFSQEAIISHPAMLDWVLKTARDNLQDASSQ